MSDIIHHLRCKVSPLLPLLIRACVAYYAVKSWFVEVDAEAAVQRCATLFERHIDRFVKVTTAAEG